MLTIAQQSKLQLIAERRKAEFAALPPVVIEPLPAPRKIQLPVMQPLRTEKGIIVCMPTARGTLRHLLANRRRQTIALRPNAQPVHLEKHGWLPKPGKHVAAEKLAAIVDAAQQRFYDQQHAAYKAERAYERREAELADRRIKLAQIREALIESENPRHLPNPAPREYSAPSERVQYTLRGVDMGRVRVQAQNVAYTFSLPVAGLDLMLGDDAQELGARLASSYRQRTVEHLLPFVTEGTWYTTDRDSQTHGSLNSAEHPAEFSVRNVPQRQSLARKMEIAHSLWLAGGTVELHMDTDPAIASVVEKAIATWHVKPHTPKVRGAAPRALGFAEDRYDPQEEELLAVYVQHQGVTDIGLLDMQRNSVTLMSEYGSLFTVLPDNVSELEYVRESVSFNWHAAKQGRMTPYQALQPRLQTMPYDYHESVILCDQPAIRILPHAKLSYTLADDASPFAGVDTWEVYVIRKALQAWKEQRRLDELVNASPSHRQHIAESRTGRAKMLSDYAQIIDETPCVPHKPLNLAVPTDASGSNILSSSQMVWDCNAPSLKSMRPYSLNAMTSHVVDELAFHEQAVIDDDFFADYRTSEIVNQERIDNYSFTITRGNPIVSFQDGTLFSEDEKISATRLHRQAAALPLDTKIRTLTYNVLHPQLYKVFTTVCTLDKQGRRQTTTNETPTTLNRQMAWARVKRGVEAYATIPTEPVWTPSGGKTRRVTQVTPYSPAAQRFPEITVYCGPAWKDMPGNVLANGPKHNVEKYKEWLKAGYRQKNSLVRHELLRLAKIAQSGPLMISAWPDSPVDPESGQRRELSKMEKRMPPAYLGVIAMAIEGIVKKAA